MENACPLIDMFSSGLCLDFWLNRYQTLFTGLAAFTATVFAIRYARKQNSLGEQQVKIMANQEKQTKAIATVKVDEALRVLETEQHWVLAKMLGAGDSWSNNGVQPFSLPSPLDDLTSAAALAFPERAIELSDAFHAAADLSKAYADFNETPWQIEVVLAALGASEEERASHLERGRKGGETAQRFLRALAKVSDLAPSARSA